MAEASSQQHQVAVVHGEMLQQPDNTVARAGTATPFQVPSTRGNAIGRTSNQSARIGARPNPRMTRTK